MNTTTDVAPHAPNAPIAVSPVLAEGETIKLVGAGGVGGVVARYGVLFVRSLCDKQGTSARWVIIDGDAFEDRNRNRMLFRALGKKAEVLRDELLTFVADSRLTLMAINEHVTHENIARLMHDGDIIILAVDNNATRKLVSDYCDTRLQRFCLISGGNDGVGPDPSGRVLRGTYGNCQVFLRGTLESPSLTRYHPEIEHPDDRLPSDLHCTEAAVSQPQILFANLAAASAMLNALWLYLAGALHYSELAFDIADGLMRPIPLAPPAPPSTSDDAGTSG